MDSDCRAFGTLLLRNLPRFALPWHCSRGHLDRRGVRDLMGCLCRHCEVRHSPADPAAQLRSRSGFFLARPAKRAHGDYALLKGGAA